MKKVLALVLTVSLLAMPHMASAQIVCTQPSQPTLPDKFTSQNDVDAALPGSTSYMLDSRTYTDCILEKLYKEDESLTAQEKADLNALRDLQIAKLEAYVSKWNERMSKLNTR